VPRSLVIRELAEGRLIMAGPEVPLEIRLYRSCARTRPAVETVWAAAGAYSQTA
jgi:hypothetical protein